MIWHLFLITIFSRTMSLRGPAAFLYSMMNPDRPLYVVNTTRIRGSCSSWDTANWWSSPAPLAATIRSVRTASTKKKAENIAHCNPRKEIIEPRRFSIMLWTLELFFGCSLWCYTGVILVTLMLILEPHVSARYTEVSQHHHHQEEERYPAQENRIKKGSMGDTRLRWRGLLPPFTCCYKIPPAENIMHGKQDPRCIYEIIPSTENGQHMTECSRVYCLIFLIKNFRNETAEVVFLDLQWSSHGTANAPCCYGPRCRKFTAHLPFSK